MPAFRRSLDSGVHASITAGIYPTQTYPIHATIITGNYPDAHGVAANARFSPGTEKPDWHWYRRDIRTPTLYDRAKQAGLRVGSILWPGAAGAAVDFNFPEIKPSRRSQNLPCVVLSNGTPAYIMSMLLRHGYLLRGLDTHHLDNFIAAAAADTLRRKKPHLLLVHLLDLDQTRHRYGRGSREAEMCLRDQDGRIDRIVAAAERARIFDRCTFFILGDHGHMDVRCRVNPNVALLEAGLIELNGRGHLAGWRAWANACGGSAQICLSDPEDRDLRDRVRGVLVGLRDDAQAGVKTVFDRNDLRRLRTKEEIAFMIEARRGYYFTNRMTGPLLEPAESRHKSSHGYLPTRGGYQPLFMAFGAGIRKGIALQDLRMIDLAPTMAALLGIDMPRAEGSVIDEMLAG